MTDRDANTAWSATFSPFMGIYEQSGNISQPLRYPEQYYDAETGLHYNWHRYYWPEAGRYITAEPIKLNTPIVDPLAQLPEFLGEQDFFIDESSVSVSYFNLYLYVRNNPNAIMDLKALFTYNQPPPGTLPLPPDTAAQVNCLESCLGIPLTVTGGAECEGHITGSAHCRGEAVDFSFKRNPQLWGMKKKFMFCACKCKFEFGQEEANPPHYHVQIGPGKGGSRGELPACGCQ